jgi:hypothetical protein
MEAEYIFYAKTDTAREAISRIKAHSIESATKAFANIKKLNIDEFTRIYTVARHSKSI